MRVALVQSYLHRETQVNWCNTHVRPKVLNRKCSDPVAADGGEDQRVSLLTVPVELDPEERLTVVLLQRREEVIT